MTPSRYSEIPRTRKAQRAEIPYGDSPKFHLSWLQDFRSLEEIIFSILSGDTQVLLRYSDLVYSSKFSDLKIIDYEDFYHHLNILTKPGNHKKLISCLRNFIETSITVEGESEYRHFDNLMLAGEKFSVRRYLSSIEESRDTGKSISSIEKRKELLSHINLVRDTAIGFVALLPK